MEVIPGSHKKEFHKNNNCIESYFQKITIDIEPGDVLVFHANLYHRGKNFYIKGDRRVLQVFEVFPDETVFQEYSDRLTTVVTSKTTALGFLTQLSYAISKMPIVINCITFFHYLLVYHDLQYKLVLSDLPPWDKKDKLISYESSQRMNYHDIHETDDINLNIICKNTITKNPSNFYLYLFLLIVILIIIYYVGKTSNQKKYTKYFSKKVKK